MSIVTVDRRLWTTADGDLVEDGDPSAAFLWAIPGDEVTSETADAVGYKPAAGSSKRAKAPQNKAVEEPASDKDGEADQDDTVDDPDSHVCDECGFEAKSAGGLGAHQRSHE